MRNYSHFTIILTTTWRCACDFLKHFAEIKNDHHGSTAIFLWAQKIKSEIIQILQSHSPRYGDVQVIFSRFCWRSKWPPRINFISWFFKVLMQSKMAATDQLHIFCGCKNLKVQNYSKHIPHNMEMCRWFFQDFTEIHNGCHGSTSIFSWPQKHKVSNYSHLTTTFPTI